MKEKFSYKFKKAREIIFLSFYDLIRSFYKNKNTDFQEMIYKNRTIIDSKKTFLTKEDYDVNTYGIPGHIFTKIDKKINNFPTYSDLFLFFSSYLSEKINYLEIGVSVLKNFVQLNANFESANLVAYDINPIAPSSKELFNNKMLESNSNIFYGSNKVNNNELIYFKGSVLDSDDTELFNSRIKHKYNFIFSDALHEPDAVMKEYQNIIKDNLDDEFILYFDDLDFEGLNLTVKNIFNDLKKSRDKIYFTTFYINGWIGQHEKLHKNGVISTINFYEILKREKIKLPLIKNWV
tara:strand:+ start:10597 stop:11475 length:879 start_codon:yes stop_codon:yes gene_type:complete